MNRRGPVAFLILCAALCDGRPAPAAPPAASTPRTWQQLQQQGFFTVSLDPDNLPYSAREGKHSGIEVELAQALARRIGLTVKIDWINPHHETSLHKLLTGKCDLVMGLPVDPRLHDDDDLAASRLLYTRPYYRAGYLLFVRKNGPRIGRLAELNEEQGRRLGTQAGTMADFALKQRGFQRKLYPSQPAVLKAVADGQLDYGYLWSNAAWLLRGPEDFPVEVVQPYELEDWRDMAAAVRRSDDELRTHLDRALTELIQEKVVEDLMKRYGLPYYPAAEPGTKPVAPGK